MMNKSALLFSLLLTTTGFASSAFATHGIDPFETRPAPSNTIKQTDQPHPDFSGKWEGVCDGGGYQKLDIVYAQGYISINGREFLISQVLQSESRSNESHAHTNFRAAAWSTDGSALIINYASVDRDVSKPGPRPMLTDMGMHIITMQNGHLDTVYKTIAFDNLTQYAKDERHCVFNKKQ